MRVQGLYVPMLTALTADGAVDPDGVAAHADWLVAAGVDGIVALGTTGEFADLTATERADVAAAAVTGVAGRAPVLVGVGGIGTAEACAHARAAAAAGADGVLALPPLYWKLGDDALVAHFARVAESAQLPLLLYDFPALSGTPLRPELVARVAREVPGVAGIKLSGPELRVAHGVLRLVKPERPDFSVMLGSADLVLPALLAGADGTIAAIGNVAPRVLLDLLGAVRQGRLDVAADRHRAVLDLLRIPALSLPPVLALKAAAAALGAPLRPVVRTPCGDADDVARQAGALVAALLGA